MLYEWVFIRITSTCLDLVGVTMVLLTTTPIGKLLLDLDLIVHMSFSDLVGPATNQLHRIG